MLEQSDAVKQAWQASERTLDIVINVDGTDYQATGINSLSYDAGAFTGDSLGIGSTYENSISAEFASVVEAFAAGQVVKPKIGIKVNGAFEYTPLGVFIISEVNRDRNNNLTTIKALDQMVKLERAYTSTLTYPAAMLDVVAEIANQGGVAVNQTDLAHLPNLPKLNSAITGQTLRTAIGWIAQFYAGFAAFDRSGQLTIRTTATPDYEINPGEYMQGGLTKNEVTYKTGGIKASVTTTSITETGEKEDKTVELHAGETTGSQIELTNNVMTNDALSTIWTSVKDVSFYPYSLNWFGNPALEAGDWVALTDTQGNKFNVPVNQLTFTFNGGLESTISANQASQSSTVIPWTGPTQNAINQAITRKTATGNNVYDPSFTEEPKNAKIGDVWFKQNGNNVELWTYSRDSSGNASWQKQEVDGEVKAQVDEAKKLAIEAQTTADGKNSVYRGSDPNTVPTARLKEGDLYFADNAVYTWTGSAWEKTVNDTTGAEINARVDEAIAKAKSAAETADAKNKVYRVKDVSVIPTANLKTGDLYFADNAVYTWTGSAWEETVSDTTGAEIKAKVDQVAQENQKAVADLTSNVESKAKDLDTSIQSTRSDLTAANNAVAKDLSTTKSDLANVSKDLSETKGNMQSGLDAVNKDLSTAKSDLANVSKDLSDTKSNLGTVSNDLSETKNNLADTGQKIETAVSDFQKKTDQLSGSLETANSKIEFNSNAISEVKHTAEEISTTVSSLKAGDRNYVRNTFNEWKTLTGFTGVHYAADLGAFYPDDLKIGDAVTIGLSVKNEGIQSGTFRVEAPGDVTAWNMGCMYGDWHDIAKDCPDGTTTTLVEYYTLTADNLKNNNFNFQLRADNFSAGTLSYKGLFVKKGTIATDWTPAPEDVNASISQLQQTANGLTSRVGDAEGNISQLQQTANGLTTRVGDAEGNISTLQQTAKGLESTVGQMPAQWQQAINDKTNAQVLSSDVDMNNLTTAGAYLVKDSSVKNAPISAWFMATVEATADKSRVVQRVKKDTDNIAYERSNTDTSWTAWERIATGTDISQVKQTIDGITTRVSNAEGNVSDLQQTAKSIQSSVSDNAKNISNVQQTASDLTSRVGNAEGNISQLQQTASGLTTRVGSAEGNISQLQQTANGLTSTVSNLKAGDRNYARNTFNEWKTLTGFTGVHYAADLGAFYPDDLKIGDAVTIGLSVKNEGIQSGTFRVEAPGDVTAWNMGCMYGDWHDIAKDCPDGTTTTLVEYYTLTADNLKNNNFNFQLRADNFSAGTLSYKGLFVKKGTIATDWTPAPEDVNASISQLQQTASGLTSRVGDAEGNISQLQQTANSLQSTISDQSGKISQLQQTANGLQSTVSNIQVGGRNLLTDTRTLSSWTNEHNGWNDTGQTFQGGAIWQCNQNSPWAKLYEYYDVKAGETYTFSVYLKSATAVTNNANIYIASSDPENGQPSAQPNPTGVNVAITNVWKRYAVTFTTQKDGIIKPRVELGNDAVDAVQMALPKLEVGNTATDWTPAPEDVDSSISQVKQTADGITAYVKESNGSKTLASLLSMDPNNSTIAQVVNGKPIAAINLSSEGDVTIDGKKLHITASTTIDDAAIGSAKIASLSADKITAGTLDASVVTVKNINADNISAGTLAAEHLHVTKDTVIDSGVIGNAQISNLSADKITAGTLDASQIRVINLDANSITTGSLSAAVIKASGFENYTVSPSNTWDFDKIKSTYGNWFLIGETTADHVYNGPKDASNNKLIPFMYVTSRGNPDGNRFTITVWKDDDPTQYQRIWTGDHWTDWVILPNSQNIVSAINLSPDSVMISGKKIMLDGDVTIDGTAFASKLKATGITVDKLVAGIIDASKINVINLNANNITAGTINGNNLSINLDNGQVAFTKGSLHSTDGMFNIDLDNKSFKIQTNNGIGLFVDDNGFHYKADSTSDLWINKDGFHSYTDSNKNGTWIKDSSLTNADVNGQGVTFQNGNVQFSSIPYWTMDNSKVYGSIYRDINFFGSSANGLVVEGNDGLTLKTSAADDSNLYATTVGITSTNDNGAFLTLSNDTSNPSLFYSNSTLYLTGGQPSQDVWRHRATVSIGTDEYYSHSGVTMGRENGTGRGNSISAHGSNVNVSATGWINFDAESDIAFQAPNYIHMYPTYIKTTSAGANVYVAADGALIRSASARKYKTDIQNADNDYGNKLIEFAPQKWIDKAEKKRYEEDPEKNKKPGYYYGLIADDLAAAGLEMLVNYGAEGEVEGINYDRLAVTLLPVIKSLKDQVASLKEQLKVLTK